MSGPFYLAGTYACRVINQAWQTTKEKKLPMLVLRVHPEHREVPITNAAGSLSHDFEPTSKQFPRTVRLVIDVDKEQSVDFAMKKLRHAGFLGAKLRDLQLEGQVIRCTCDHQPHWEKPGEVVEQWDLELPPREDDELESDDAVVRKLDAILGKKLKETAPGAKAPAARQAPPAFQEGEDPLGGAFDPPAPKPVPAGGGWD